MLKELNDTIRTEVEKPTTLPVPYRLLDDYEEILEKFKVEFVRSEYYFEVGEPKWVQGWIIDISVIPVQVQDLYEIVIPLLIRETISFKIARNAKYSRAILGGELGLLLLGKVVSIYPVDELQALKIAKELIELTRAFRGPQILTDRQLLGVIYVRYGAGKPVLQINENGIEEKYIYNSRGDLEKESYSIPFRLPEGIKWPFGSIVSPEAPKKETILQDRYKPMEVLKEDTKGYVKKGLYLEKWWKIKWCVIKEGKRNMIGDSRGRDITDRLRWQYELHKELEQVVPMPKIYDLFEENGDTYLIMEFIRGKALHHTTTAILRGRTFDQLSLLEQLQLLDYADQALDIIDRMHQKGYIHRDITPANFLVNKKQELCMIDLELSYCKRLGKPYPPFRLGTPGFMSPEQLDTRTPTVEQDIYALGSLIIVLLTGLMPDKFALEHLPSLKIQLQFFIPDSSLIELLASCLENDPKLRPNTVTLKEEIEIFRKKQINKASVEPKSKKPISSPPDAEDLRKAISDALNGLTNKSFLNADQLWISRKAQVNGFVYDQDGSFSVYPDFYQGISGILWLLGVSKRMGSDITTCLASYQKSRIFIRENYYNRSINAPGGLFFGTAGLAIALTEGVRNGLIINSEDNLKEIRAYYENENVQGYGIMKGLAGQGIALLKAEKILDEPVRVNLLNQNISLLLSHQQKDGSWVVSTNSSKRPIALIGFGHGVAGITLFLLNYLQLYKDSPSVRQSALKALEWLKKMAFKKHNHTRWPKDSVSQSSSPGFRDGCAGVILCLIKGYQVFGDFECRELAEDCLRGYPSDKVSCDITQINGLVGLGEVYLEAARVFHSDQWQEMADGTVALLLHHYHRNKDDSLYWMPDSTPFTTAGLMEGNSGIIHFLLRYQGFEKLSHPLLAI